MGIASQIKQGYLERRLVRETRLLGNVIDGMFDKRDHSNIRDLRKARRHSSRMARLSRRLGYEREVVEDHLKRAERFRERIAAKKEKDNKIKKDNEQNEKKEKRERREELLEAAKRGTY